MNPWDRNLAILDDLWDRLLTVELIAEPLATCTAADDTAAVRRRLEQNRWNQIGFREPPEQGGAAVGYLDHEDFANLSGSLSEAGVRRFTVGELVSAQTPLRDGLMRLAEARRLFVLGPKGVSGIATVADLQKPPVRILLFGTVSLLEMAMLSRIQRQYPGGRWTDRVSPSRRRKAERLYEHRRAAGHDTDLAACLELCDKSDILTQDAADRAALGFTSHKECKRFFHRMERLRDNLAHVQDPTEVADWSTIGAMLVRSEELVRQLGRHG